MALRILLEGGPQRDQKLAELREAVEAAREGRIPCPECGDPGPHDDNGAPGCDVSLCCRVCGMHFDLHPV